MKEQTIKLSDYFQLVKPSYIYIQITPHKSIRNFNSSNIAKAIANTYKSINKQIRIEKKKLFFETNFKISYVVDITKDNTSFYFIVPKPFINIIVEKISEIWNKATVSVLEEGIRPFSKEAEYLQVTYKKEDPLSLAVDKKSNEPLNSILSVVDIMKDDDRVSVIYNFLPMSQSNWIDRYELTMTKLKNKKSIEKQILSMDYILRNTVVTVLDVFNSLISVICDFAGVENKIEEDSLFNIVNRVIQQQDELSVTTKKKRDATVLNTQIAIVSDSNDITRMQNNINSVCSSFRVLDEDNSLIPKQMKPLESIEQYDFNIDRNTFSTDEISNFIQIPGRSLLSYFNINHIKTEETVVPEELRKGYFNLGRNVYKGTNIETYLEDEYNVGSYPLAINGSQGAGKSTFIANGYRFARSRGEGGVLIDYIKNNELTEEVVKYIPKDDIILLDYSNDDCMQGFAFNEVANLDKSTPYQEVKIANLQVMQFLELINAINIDQPLQARMRKYLVAAGTIVFVTGETSLKEIINCLEDHEKRHYYISKLPTETIHLLEDKIKILKELDEYSKPTKDNPITEIIGTKDSRIDGILDRVSILKEDIALEYMFNKGAKNNINFAKELEKGKLIIIKMLQDEWSSQAKDVITTFFISKIWLSTEIRGKWNLKPKRSHIAIDEIFQCPTAMKMLSDKKILPQTRKFGCKFWFTTQGLQQLKDLFTSIVDAGGTFMLLKGTKEEDFNLLKNKIEGFEYDDLRDMSQTYKYPSLNLVYYSRGYSSFITALPKPIKGLR